MSSLRVRHANCSVVGCKNQHKCLYSVPATEQQKRQRLCFIFNDNVPAAVRVSLYVCANHFTSDCFSNECQYKAGFASTLTLIKGSVPELNEYKQWLGYFCSSSFTNYISPGVEMEFVKLHFTRGRNVVCQQLNHSIKRQL